MLRDDVIDALTRPHATSEQTRHTSLVQLPIMFAVLVPLVIVTTLSKRQASRFAYAPGPTALARLDRRPFAHCSWSFTFRVNVRRSVVTILAVNVKVAAVADVASIVR